MKMGVHMVNVQHKCKAWDPMYYLIHGAHTTYCAQGGMVERAIKVSPVVALT